MRRETTGPRVNRISSDNPLTRLIREHVGVMHASWKKSSSRAKGPERITTIYGIGSTKEEAKRDGNKRMKPRGGINMKQLKYIEFKKGDEYKFWGEGPSYTHHNDDSGNL